ncbi:MAG TPA: hypothetical protein VE843_13755 [Ktedonobacteraceae bacterium]|nr:hypothetical protein [Ktedonobacteraceae bacterium]
MEQELDSLSAKERVRSALLAHEGDFLSYQEIQDLVRAPDLEEIGMESLRNAISQLNQELAQDGSNWLLERTKLSGKKVGFKIVARQTEGGELVEILHENQFASLESVARGLMRGALPFYGVYLPLRAAGEWVRYSALNEGSLNRKRMYEGDQCEALLNDWLVRRKDENQTISLLGFGVGEGTGEIEIISRLLKRGFQVHYCAIDMNTYFLMDHATRLKYKFQDPISQKALTCAVICGDFLKDLKGILHSVREEFQKRRLCDAFLPSGSGLIVSILGNLMGNSESKASEGTYIDVVRDQFVDHDIAFLLGVGIGQEKMGARAGRSEKTHFKPEHYPLDELFLATPRYLTLELEILHSSAPNEFYLNENGSNYQLSIHKYEGDGLASGDHVEGDIYEFLYETQGDISMTSGGESPLAKGSKILLYKIIKFDLRKLLAFLRSQKVRLPSEDIKTINVGTAEDPRVYAVLAGLVGK